MRPDISCYHVKPPEPEMHYSVLSHWQQVPKRLLPLLLVTLHNLVAKPYAKHTTHLCYQTRRNSAGAELEALTH